MRDEVGAVASLRQVDIVAALPKTRSGKILRKTMREMADGKTPTVPGTIEDASVLDALASVLRPGCAAGSGADAALAGARRRRPRAVRAIILRRRPRRASRLHQRPARPRGTDARLPRW